MFEAAVGGAVPIIHGVRNCFEASEINGIYGILNGTTNYILTKMIQENLSFGVALKQAQELGYAEADPSGDVDGIDTCRQNLHFDGYSYKTENFTGKCSHRGHKRYKERRCCNPCPFGLRNKTSGLL